MRPIITLAAALTTAIAAAGCGLKGPLYLPDQVTNVEVRPVSSPAPPTGNAPPATTGAAAGSTSEADDEDDVESQGSTTTPPQD